MTFHLFWGIYQAACIVVGSSLFLLIAGFFVLFLLRKSKEASMERVRIQQGEE